MKAFTLVGVDGNAYSVMGYVTNAMRTAGMPKAERDEYLKNAMSDDYNHLLVVSMDMIDKVNQILEEKGELDSEYDEEEDW